MKKTLLICLALLLLANLVQSICCQNSQIPSSLLGVWNPDSIEKGGFESKKIQFKELNGETMLLFPEDNDEYATIKLCFNHKGHHYLLLLWNDDDEPDVAEFKVSQGRLIFKIFATRMEYYK
jgi:hypothetical protein